MVNNFVDWCQHKHLQLNVRKTKSPPVSVTIQGENIEGVMYLGVHLCDNMAWEVNMDRLYKKAQR